MQLANIAIKYEISVSYYRYSEQIEFFLDDEEKKMREKPAIVLASGVFDLIHYGHVFYLKEAKKAGGKNAKLIVIVARDKSLEKSCKKPIVPEEQRRAIVEALKPVDEAILGYEPINLEYMIAKIKPDIIAVGFDQGSMEDAVKKIINDKGFRIKVIKIKQFRQEKLNSSSKIKKKIMSEQKFN
jgi:FAD synthetase